MIQLKLTNEQFWNLFNALYEAEKSLEHLAIDAKGYLGTDWLVEEATKESLQYKELRRFITDTKEVI